MKHVVLVAERDEALLSLLSNAIGGLGFEVIGASDPVQAARLCNERAPDLIVLGEGMEEALEAAPHSTVVTAALPGSIDEPAFEYRIRRAIQTRNRIRHLESVLGAIPDSLFHLERSGNFRPISGSGPVPPFPERMPEAGVIHEAEFEHEEEGRNFEVRTVPFGNGEAIAMVRDVTERKKAEDRIRHLAYFDNLTGLPNRNAFLNSLEAESRRCDRTKLAVFMIDIDFFSKINELLGRDVGDHLLKGMAGRLSNCFTEGDRVSVSRYGPDEFAVMISDIGRVENAFSLARRIKDAVGHPFVIDSREVVVTCTIGISLCPEDSRDAGLLVKHAEFAKERAKDSGSDRIQLYSNSLTKQMLYRRDLESSLRKALGRGEFLLHYQPRVENSKVVRAEALIRWRRSEHVLVPPVEFIPLAEETGLILPIGEWVLRTACIQAGAWRDEGMNIGISVNLSPHQLREENFRANILSLLEETGLSPDLLELEIPEDALMDLADSSLIDELAEAGVRLAVDRFGSGYTSMNRLKRFRLDTLKISREIIAGIGTSQEDEAMARAIIAMAGNLGMEVVAVGVETAGQAEKLKRWGCKEAQGFHFDGLTS